MSIKKEKQIADSLELDKILKNMKLASNYNSQSYSSDNTPYQISFDVELPDTFIKQGDYIILKPKDSFYIPYAKLNLLDTVIYTDSTYLKNIKKYIAMKANQKMPSTKSGAIFGPTDFTIRATNKNAQIDTIIKVKQ